MSARTTRPYVDAFFAVATDPAGELAALEAFRHAYDQAPELGKVLSNPGLERDRGGLRVIYYLFLRDSLIWFVTLYGKGEAADLTASEKRRSLGSSRTPSLCRS